MKKLIPGFILCLLLFAIIVCFSVFHTISKHRNEEFNKKLADMIPGQVWLWTYKYDKKNPFEEETVVKFVVLETKEGYVKYTYTSNVLDNCTLKSKDFTFSKGIQDFVRNSVSFEKLPCNSIQ